MCSMLKGDKFYRKKETMKGKMELGAITLRKLIHV